MALSDTAIRNAKPKDREFKLADSGGLYLLITPSGGKLWRQKFRVDGKERKLSIGRYPPCGGPSHLASPMLKALLTTGTVGMLTATFREYSPTATTLGGLFGGPMKTALAKKNANPAFLSSNVAHFTLQLFRLASCPSWIDCHSAYMNDGYSGICPQSSGVAA